MPCKYQASNLTAYAKLIWFYTVCEGVYRLMYTFSQLQMQQAERILPMTLTLATVDTLDPLTIEIMRLGRQMVQPYTQGIVTEMAYISVTNIQMLCANHETQSVSGGTFPPSSNRALVFNSPIAGLLHFTSP